MLEQGPRAVLRRRDWSRASRSPRRHFRRSEGSAGAVSAHRFRCGCSVRTRSAGPAGSEPAALGAAAAWWRGRAALVSRRGATERWAPQERRRAFPARRASPESQAASPRLRARLPPPDARPLGARLLGARLGGGRRNGARLPRARLRAARLPRERLPDAPPLAAPPPVGLLLAARLLVGPPLAEPLRRGRLLLEQPFPAGPRRAPGPQAVASRLAPQDRPWRALCRQTGV